MEIVVKQPSTYDKKSRKLWRAVSRSSSPSVSMKINQSRSKFPDGDGGSFNQGIKKGIILLSPQDRKSIISSRYSSSK